jgi:integrase/recombinase XerD
MSGYAFSRWSIVDRVKPGVVAPFLQKYEEYLLGQSYRTDSIAKKLRAACHFGQWLTVRKLTPNQIDDKVLSRFAAHRCRCSGIRRNSKIFSRDIAQRAKHFVTFLRLRGIVREEPREIGLPAQVSAFCDYLLHQIGLSPVTTEMYKRNLQIHLSILGDDPATYDAVKIRQLAFSIAEGRAPVSTRMHFTALRGYLRFLAARGKCRPGLDHAVPTIANWKLSALPRYLMPNDVERVIASCDLNTHQGVRDRAILLLLARLGLRGGDVLHLCLDDINWKSATFRLCGKGRREVRMPLPQDVGDALLTYLEEVRPTVKEPRIFIRSRAPYRPFVSSTAISDVVRSALERAGVKSQGSCGAHLLRHSAATTLLRAGTPLGMVSTLLRHRSLDTTMHYAKVNLPMLSRIAQPWPRDVPC